MATSSSARAAFKVALWMAVCSALVIGVTQAAAQEPLRITETGTIRVTSAAPDAETELDPDDYTIGEIYDVYATARELDGRTYLADFVDSIYLVAVEPDELVFEYAWAGQSRFMQPGQYLLATGRQFGSEQEEIQLLTSSRRGGLTSRWSFAGYVQSGMRMDAFIPGVSPYTPTDGTFTNPGAVPIGGDLELLLHFFELLALRMRVSSGPYFQSLELSTFTDYRQRIGDSPLIVYLGLGLPALSTGMARYNNGMASTLTPGVAFSSGLALSFAELSDNGFVQLLLLDLEAGTRSARDGTSVVTLDYFVAVKLGVKVF